jgi:hypothetical protein
MSANQGNYGGGYGQMPGMRGGFGRGMQGGNMQGGTMQNAGPGAYGAINTNPGAPYNPSGGYMNFGPQNTMAYGGPSSIGSGYQKPMMQPQAATRAPMQQSPQFTGDPNNYQQVMQWQIQNQMPQTNLQDNGARYGGGQNDPMTMFGGRAPWNAQQTNQAPFGPMQYDPGRYHGFARPVDAMTNEQMGRPPSDFGSWLMSRR